MKAALAARLRGLETHQRAPEGSSLKVTFANLTTYRGATGVNVIALGSTSETMTRVASPPTRRAPGRARPSSAIPTPSW